MLRNLLLAGALGLLSPAVVLAQPAPHHQVGETIDVRASVFLSGSDVLIEQNKSNVFRVTNDAWIRFLRSSNGQTIEARLRITKAGMFGGDVEVLSVTRDIEGFVQLPAGGAPMIAANKSAGYTVTNAPFKAILAGLDGRKVQARVHVVTPGMFGAEVEVKRLAGTTSGQARVRLSASSAAPTIATLPAGRAVSISGGNAHYFSVVLPNGRQGYVPRSSVEVGQANPDSTITRLDSFDFKYVLEWSGDDIQYHLKLTRQADGSYLADADGEDYPSSKTNVRLSASAVDGLLRALSAAQAIPDDGFGGDGNHFYTEVDAKGSFASGAPLAWKRFYYDMEDERIAKLAGDLNSQVEQLVKTITAGPVTGLTGSVPH